MYKTHIVYLWPSGKNLSTKGTYIFFLLSAPSLSDFFIRVGNIFVSDTNFDPTTYTECWHQVDPLPPGNTAKFSCSETVTGRSVLIHYSANKTGRLALCEVEVYLEEGTYPLFYFTSNCRKCRKVRGCFRT